jgi:hypothetical protein
MDPAPFAIKPTAKESAELGDAIRWGYAEMDRMLARIMSMARPDATIVFATALSQQPCVLYEASGGKTFYRAHELGKLLEFAGIDPRTCMVEPVMSEEFFLRFDSDEHAIAAQDALVALRVSGRTAFKARREGNAVFAGCTIFNALPEDAELLGPGGRLPFFELMYGVDTVKSGMHHPAGALWIRTPDLRHEEHPEPVALERVAPTLLTLLGLPAPPELPEPLLDATVTRPLPLKVAV